MTERLDEIYQTKDTMTIPALQKLLEKWDSDQGCAMKHAEDDLLRRPQKPFAWSPQLRNDGLLYRYWHLRLKEKTYSVDYQHTLRRMEKATQQHDPSFILPFLDIPLPLSKIKRQLDTAKAKLKESQRNSQNLRYRCYTYLLAVYESDRAQKVKKSRNVAQRSSETP
jgi:hypothetical protein